MKHVIKPITFEPGGIIFKKAGLSEIHTRHSEAIGSEEDNSVLALTIFYNLENVFYSVSMNSCLYVSTERMSFDNDTNFITMWFQMPLLDNY